MRPALLNPLFAPVTTLGGVGPKQDKLFRYLLGRDETPRLVDLLLHLPASVIDRRARPKIRDAAQGTVVTLEVTVDRHRPPPPRNARAPFLVYASDDTGDVVLTFFRAKPGYVEKLLPKIADARLNTPVTSLRRLPGVTGGGGGGGGGGVMLSTAQGSERFDAVVLASHSDQSLALLSDASLAERQILGAIGYHRNRAVLHTDTALLPRRRRAWAAWNYEHGGDSTGGAGQGQEPSAVCLHYLLNRLQPLPWQQPTIVSLNPVREPAAARVLGEYDYAHPVFDQTAITAQQRLPDIQGAGQVWFCGAWTRYGFHEDGLLSGLSVARQMMTAWSGQPTRLAL